MPLQIPGRTILLRCLVLASFALGLPGCAKNMMVNQSGAVVVDAVVVTAVVAATVAVCYVGCHGFSNGGRGSSYSSGGSPEATGLPAPAPGPDAMPPGGGGDKFLRNL
jgi:hypothetical protein